MHLVMLSGGSGKRLWPLSNGVRAKQFLELLRADDGSMESMVHRICRQISGATGIKWDTVTVVAGAAQRDQLLIQLDKGFNVLTEPDRRDTFPAISYAAAWLYAEKNLHRDEVIAFMPVDPFVESDFFDAIALIERELVLENADIVLIGNRPSEPSEKFGYILVDLAETTGDSCSSPVKGFKEKPGIPEAKKMIAEGALWNCGIFGMRLGYILDILEEKYAIKQFDKEYMTKAFMTLPKTSFDYEVVESAENVRVIEYTGVWKDLGTWDSLSEEMCENRIGNVVANACADSHIINELDIPLVSVGMRDTVVVASHDGILVTKKKETNRLKDIVSSFEDRPMYEKRRWGEYLVLHRSSTGDEDTLTKKLTLNVGEQISYQTHEHRKEVWTILHGSGILYLNDEKRKIVAGDIISIDIGDKHGLYASTTLELIEIQFGFPLIESDIHRLEFDWNPDTK